MRILYLTYRLPYPPDRGDKIRSYHHLRHLAASHEVHLVSFVDAVDEGGEAPLRSICRSVDLVRLRPRIAYARAGAALLGGEALSAAYFRAGAMRGMLSRVLARAKFDVAWAVSAAMAPYLADLPVRRRVLDLVDVDSEKWREYAERTRGPLGALYAVEARRLRRLELEATRRADRVLLISAGECALLRCAAPSAPLAVVGNGVDTDFFRPLEAAPGPCGVLFTGTLEYRPNADAVTFFLRDILPRLRGRVPGVCFTAVGHRPPARLVRAARRAGARIEGSVPDVRPYFADALVYVAPLRFGRGVKNKVLEAMAMGVPVVASRAAVEGLEVEDGVHFVGAQNGEEFAIAIAELAVDAEQRRRLAVAARRRVERSFRWADQLRAIDELLVELAAPVVRSPPGRLHPGELRDVL